MCCSLNKTCVLSVAGILFVAATTSAQDQCRVGVLTADDGVYWDYFGESVAISGDTLVAGAPYHDEGGSATGSVYIFWWNGSDWLQEVELTASDAQENAYLGVSVAISGDYVIAGAHYDDNLGVLDTGSAYIFKRDATGWVEEAKLLAGDPSESAFFGLSVSIDGQYAVVGAYNDDEHAVDAGAAYVFKREPTGWNQEAKLRASDASPDGEFGRSAAISGDCILVGATRDGDGSAGAAYVFKRESAVWAEQAKLTGGDDTHAFGFSVALQGNYAVMRAQGALGSRILAHVYRREVADWILDGKLTLVDPPDGGWSITPVSIDGGYIAAGPYVFMYSGGAWVEVAWLQPTAQGFAGLSISGSRVAVGVSMNGWYNNGAVYLYQLAGGTDCNGNTVIDACDIFDCNDNGVPDECEPLVDCNGNGAQDTCDLYTGYSEDCNVNGIPDECDLSSGTSDDCNVNDIPDECDVDCNDNGIPDDCDISSGTSPDCNDNGVPDECDIAGYASRDCNANAVPDECDIAAGTSNDCNIDGIPDECQPNDDCNENGVEDLCDLGAETSPDCNANLIPDECDIASGTSEDCEGNGIPDECPAEDCNYNGIEDFCDILSGASQDLNGDGVPDECRMVYSLLPKATTDPEAIIDGNDITLSGGGHHVWLEFEAANWVCPKTWQAKIDPSGYASGLWGTLTPWNPPCTSTEDCAVLMGSYRSECDDPGYPPGGCAPGFQDFGDDWTMAFGINAVNIWTLNFTYGSTCLAPGCCAWEDTQPHYAGSVVLDVPPGALGTFTISFVDEDTWMKDLADFPIPRAPLRPAVIRIPGGCCMPDGSCNSADPAPCLAAGGMLTDPVCQGDCDGDGVDDACGEFVDCNGNAQSDACDLATGTSEDVNINGTPDECEPGACCACPPDTGCQDTLAGCNGAGGHFVPGATCAEVTCPTSVLQNDDCVDGLVVSDGAYSFGTGCSTTDGPATVTDGCVFNPPDWFREDIWFEYPATCTGLLHVEAFDTDYDALVAVYCDGSDTCTCPTDGSTEYACNQQGDVGSAVDVPVTAGNCYTIRVGGFAGAAGSGQLDVTCFEPSSIPTSTPRTEPNGADKNRFISFEAGDPGRPQALRVTFADLPAPYEHLNGRQMWVGRPYAVSESSGDSGPTPPPTYNMATLQCDPYFTDWSTLGVVHVTGKDIIPSATYEIQAVDSLFFPTMCHDGLEPVFSEPLSVSTGWWGDLVGSCTVTPCTGPDRKIDFTDLAAVADKFHNYPTAIIKPRADVAPAIPDRVIDFVDIPWVVDAFRSLPYPFGGPEGCP